MDSVINFYAALIHKPLGSLTLVEIAELFGTYLAVAIGLVTVGTLLFRK